MNESLRENLKIKDQILLNKEKERYKSKSEKINVKPKDIQ